MSPLAIDRAGLVGKTAPPTRATDIAFCAACQTDPRRPQRRAGCYQLLNAAYHPSPRRRAYPRGNGPGAPSIPPQPLWPWGWPPGVIRAAGCPAQLWCIAARGPGHSPAQGFALCDMRWIKPHTALIRQQLAQVSLLVSLEEGSIMGGAGSAVAEFLAAEGLVVPLLQLGLPGSKY